MTGQYKENFIYPYKISTIVKYVTDTKNLKVGIDNVYIKTYRAEQTINRKRRKQ